jgi:hypothetical protein
MPACTVAASFQPVATPPSRNVPVPGALVRHEGQHRLPHVLVIRWAERLEQHVPLAFQADGHGDGQVARRRHAHQLRGGHLFHAEAEGLEPDERVGCEMREAAQAQRGGGAPAGAIDLPTVLEPSPRRPHEPFLRKRVFRDFSLISTTISGDSSCSLSGMRLCRPTLDRFLGLGPLDFGRRPMAPDFVEFQDHEPDQRSSPSPLVPHLLQ